MLESISYTVAAVLLYLLSDWVLRQAERLRGRHFENRTIVFFFILLGASLVVFALIRRLLAAATA